MIPGIAGLAPKERAIMDRWDAGLSMERIAEATDSSIEHVRVVVARFALADGDRKRADAAARGSAMLRDAMLRLQARAA